MHISSKNASASHYDKMHSSGEIGIDYGHTMMHPLTPCHCEIFYAQILYH